VSISNGLLTPCHLSVPFKAESDLMAKRVNKEPTMRYLARRRTVLNRELF